MLIEKTYDATIVTDNPINFCINKEHHVLIEIRRNYLYKCFDGAFITKINKILQISSCRIISTNSSANGQVDVRFLADVYVLNSWDILIGVEIERSQSLIIGKYKKDYIEIDNTFKPTNIQTNTLQLKQLLPVRVVKSIHQPKHSQISAAGILLTCDKNIIIYKPALTHKTSKHKNGELYNLSSFTDINIITDKINAELILRSEMFKTKKYEILFFESLLYSYKATTKDTELIKGSNEIDYEGPINNIGGINAKNIFDVLQNGLDMNGYWSRPLGIYRSSPLIAFTSEKPEEYILLLPDLIIQEFAKSILNYLVAIRELVETYNTPELIKSHENVWNMMRLQQM